MLYYSTHKSSEPVNFKEAAIRGQAPDKGLYFPERIPQLPAFFIKNIRGYSKEAIGLTVMQPYVGHTIGEAELQQIIEETLAFDFPLVPVAANIWSLELFHGPTLAFKDVGARFMSRCLGHFVKGMNKKVTVLVATSGDTGGAVAAGFYDVEGVEVVILFPSGKVSATQEVQLTNLGKNITALEVDGSFDDCQHLVKAAFADAELNKNLFLTSANSINIARWLPQQLYYFLAYQQWKDKDQPPVVSVPSGNFGNICAGLLAYKSGLPFSHFIAACNANDTVPEYLQTGIFPEKKSVPTLSNAMDVAHPSNLVRMLELFGNDLSSLKEMVTAYSLTDAVTKQTIETIYQQHNYLLDPHGAVGFAALQHYLALHPEAKGLFLETAHPVKFHDVIEPIIRQTIPLPDSISALMKQEKHSRKIKADEAEVREVLMSLK